MILIIFGRACQFMLALATVRLATTLLTPVEMGKVALITAATVGLTLVFVNPVGMFINRRLHAWETSGRLGEYLRIYLLYLIVIAGVTSICISVAYLIGIIDHNVGVSWMLLLVGGSLIFNTLNQTYIPSLNMLGFPGWFILLTLATQALGLGFAVAFTVRAGGRAEYWLFGLLLGQTVLALAGKSVFERKIKNSAPVVIVENRLTRPHFVGLFAFAWPLSIAVGLGWVQSQSYRFVMEGASGLAELGLFVAGYSVSAGIIAGFESVFTTYFQPKFYRSVNTNDMEKRAAAWTAYAEALFPALIVTVFLVSSLADELSRVLLGPAFREASIFVLWGALAEAARVLVGMYSLVAHAQMKTRLLVLPNTIGAIAALSLALLLIPHFGATGAGATLALSGLGLFVVMNWQMRKQLPIRLPIRRLTAGVLGGGILLITVEIIDQSFGRSGGGMKGPLVIIAVVGLLYIALQFWLLAPVLRPSLERT